MSNNYFNPPAEFSQNAWISDMEQYRSVYNKSIQDPVQFWEKIADRVSWMKKWDTVREFDFVNGEIKWFDGGELNVSYNCLDRHVEAGYGLKVESLMPATTAWIVMLNRAMVRR